MTDFIAVFSLSCLSFCIVDFLYFFTSLWHGIQRYLDDHWVLGRRDTFWRKLPCKLPLYSIHIVLLSTPVKYMHIGQHIPSYPDYQQHKILCCVHLQMRWTNLVWSGYYWLQCAIGTLQKPPSIWCWCGPWHSRMCSPGLCLSHVTINVYVYILHTCTWPT